LNKTINVLHRLKSGVSCGYGVPPNKLGGQGLKVIVMNKSKETVTAGFSAGHRGLRCIGELPVE